MAQYSFGQTATLTATFKNTAGAETDPTTITLRVTSPSGTETSYTYAASTVSRTSTGVYYKALRMSAAGTWKYRWVATGAVQQETPDISISVCPSVFADA